MRRIKQTQITIVDCRFAAKKSKIVSRKSTVAMRLFAVLLLGTLLGGCSTVSPWARSRQLSYQAKLSAPYDQIKLKQSIIQNAVPKIQRLQDELEPGFAEAELISHSDNVVVSLGQSKDGYKSWFNMVTFQENELNAVRKYFFFVDDKARSFELSPSRGLSFDCEMVIGEEMLSEPGTAENARRIAMLRNVLDNFHKDIAELRGDTEAPDQENKMLDICRMLINQAFEVVLRELDSSPVLATRLSQAGGVEFDHINFDKGKIQMVVGGNIVMVKIRLGAFTHMIEVKKSKPKKERVRKPSSVFRR
jgi:outer membrane murein-binding lipoprotein Lpp